MKHPAKEVPYFHAGTIEDLHEKLCLIGKKFPTYALTFFGARDIMFPTSLSSPLEMDSLAFRLMLEGKLERHFYLTNTPTNRMGVPLGKSFYLWEQEGEPRTNFFCSRYAGKRICQKSVPEATPLKHYSSASLTENRVLARFLPKDYYLVLIDFSIFSSKNPFKSQLIDFFGKMPPPLRLEVLREWKNSTIQKRRVSNKEAVTRCVLEAQKLFVYEKNSGFDWVFKTCRRMFSVLRRDFGFDKCLGFITCSNLSFDSFPEERKEIAMDVIRTNLARNGGILADYRGFYDD